MHDLIKQLISALEAAAWHVPPYSGDCNEIAAALDAAQKWKEVKQQPPSPVDDDPGGWHARDEQIAAIARHFREPVGDDVERCHKEGLERAERQYVECYNHSWKSSKDAAKKIISRYLSAMPDETALIRQLVDAEKELKQLIPSDGGKG